jgi:hypothetical protein
VFLGQGSAWHLQRLGLGLPVSLHGVHLGLGLVPGHDGDVLHQPGNITVALAVKNSHTSYFFMLGLNKVAYQISALKVAWKCL